MAEYRINGVVLLGTYRRDDFVGDSRSLKFATWGKFGEGLVGWTMDSLSGKVEDIVLVCRYKGVVWCGGSRMMRRLWDFKVG